MATQIDEREVGALAAPLCPQQRPPEDKILGNAAILHYTWGNQIKHEIQTGNHSPIHCKPYKYSLVERKKALERIREFEASGWIEPATGRWLFPVVLVPKKNGSIRICIDYRKLNDITIKDVYPLLRIDDLLDAIGCANYFSKFDIQHNFHHILVKEEDRPKTAFVLFEGTWQWVRCPMGICNAPATFQRAMNVTFQNFVNKTRLTQGMINFCVIVYMDDILVYSETYHGHAQHIEWTLGTLRDVGFKIVLEKSEFFLSEISFLGYVVTRGGLRHDSRKVAALDCPNSRLHPVHDLVTRSDPDSRSQTDLDVDVRGAAPEVCESKRSGQREQHGGQPAVLSPRTELQHAIVLVRLPLDPLSSATRRSHIENLGKRGKDMAEDKWENRARRRQERIRQGGGSSGKGFAGYRGVCRVRMRGFGGVKAGFMQGFSGKGAFAELGIEFLHSADREDLAEMLKVGLEGGAINKDIIEVNDDTNFEEVAKDVVHGGLEYGRGVGESEGHHEELVVPEARTKCDLVGVLLTYVDLVEATAEVNFGEVKYLAPRRRSRSSEIRGRGYLFLIVIRFKAR
ncbi:hypothetical protein CBR_g4289 [Chara braunii]|uniref:Reverse transcriptase domain-containing protein n=1 Tax=Chara braunii TaxID=69332 RepID=A0A388JRD4_CHABU|nr:hypothetical protein CBR_g4289 [Chara braunii]|eukprot:GBG60333.1 hypothetical protein CBR_g4289 [Chara braunii]